MRSQSFDLRWIFVIVLVVLLLLEPRSLPYGVNAALALIAGGYLLNAGWQRLRGSGASVGPRVTYWRGQRIVLNQGRRSLQLPPWPILVGALLYLLLGLLTLAVVLLSLLGRSGLL